jgi:putative GTP pyrophosphokinase
MALASEILARAQEGLKSSIPHISDNELIHEFLDLDDQLGLLKLLKNLNAADKEVTKNQNLILIIAESGELEIKTFRDATDAIKALFVLEVQNPGKDVVLVRGNTSDDVRIAFRNYFSDAREFIQLIEQSCEKLTAHKTWDMEIDEADEMEEINLSDTQ